MIVKIVLIQPKLRKPIHADLVVAFYNDWQRNIHQFTVKQGVMSSAVNFQPSQIVCLEHQDTRLYAEVIQIVESRQVAWVRPLMLVVSLSNQPDSEPFTLYDLRQGADLLWPSNLFRPALDTEVLPLFTHLQMSKTQGENKQLAHQQLQRFVRQVWQDYPGKF